MRLITPTLLYFSLSLVIHSTYLEAYDPVDLCTIDCGSSDYSFYTQEQANDGRTWLVDRYYTVSTVFSSGNDKVILLPILTGESDNASANTLAPFINQIPYGTSRLSRSQFKYTFPVTTAGPKFLRLFFYPASYSGGFNRGDASFTVKSNGFTLLKDFNASLTADAEGLDTIFREYTIYVNKDLKRVELSFTPTTSSSYAFINGIEVVSMPSDLYYTPSSDPGFKLLGSRDNTLYSVANSTALETSYRIKVGGQTISPSKDTGLFRNWEGNDDLYLRTPSALGSEEADSTGAMNITVSPDYAAPGVLYRTGRYIGFDGEMANLTWEFPVDAGFTYMLRLHFYELESYVLGDRVFVIYVAGKIVDDHADVMKWANNKKRGCCS